MVVILNKTTKVIDYESEYPLKPKIVQANKKTK